MYSYEKKVFEVSSLDTKSYLKKRYVYIIITLLIVISMFLFQSVRLYLILGLLIPIVLGVIIERDIKKRKTDHQVKVIKQFKDIFYPSILSNDGIDSPYKYIDQNNTNEMIQSSEMYVHHDVEIHVQFQCFNDEIILTQHQLNHKKMNRVFISSPFDEDISVEMRSLIQPKNKYTYKESMAGFIIYAFKKEHIQTYKKLYEKLRVMKDIDQLDVKIKNGYIFITYKLSGLHIPNRYQNHDKVIQSHEAYIKYVIESYQAISKTLKERTHAYRN
jgi:hypothetical protein